MNEKEKAIELYQDFEIDSDGVISLLVASGMSNKDAEEEILSLCHDCRGTGKLLIGQVDDLDEIRCHCRADDEAASKKDE